MERFDWRDGERVVHFGRGRLADAVELVGGPGFVLLTTERAEIAALRDAASAVHHVSAGRVDELADALLDEISDGVERIVALGGGRVIDTAKAVAAGRGGARVAAVPTTLSGAEMTWVHRHATRVPAETPRARPAVVVYDPAVVASQPVPELAASALNALGHAAEAPCTTMASPVPTLMALEAARLIGGAFAEDAVTAVAAAGPGAVAAAAGVAEPDRDALALASLLAGAAIDSAWYGLHHVLSQTAVRVCDVGHGPANAILLPHTLAALGRRFPEQHKRLGEALGGDPATVAATICALTGATRLTDLGITAEQLDDCADAAAERGELDLTPPRADRDEIRAIYAATAGSA